MMGPSTHPPKFLKNSIAMLANNFYGGVKNRALFPYLFTYASYKRDVLKKAGKCL